MMDATFAYADRFDKATNAMLGAYDHAVKQYTIKLEIDKATAVQNEMKGFKSAGTKLRPKPADPDPAPTPKPAPTSDPLLKRLNTYKQRHADATAAAKKKLTTVIDERIKAVAATGDLDKLKPLMASKETFEAEGTVGNVPDVKIKLAFLRYLKEIEASEKSLAGAYRVAIAQAKRLGRKQLLETLLAESEGINVQVSVGRKIDMLKLIKLDRDAHPRDKWAMKNGQLACVRGSFVPKVLLPYQPAEEYDVRITWSQPRLRNGISIIVPNPQVPGKQFAAGAAGSRGGVSFSVARFGQKGPRADMEFSPNTKYTMVLKMRKKSAKIYINGKLMVEADDFSEFGTNHWLTTKAPKQIAIAADDPTLFTVVEVTEVTGKGRSAK